MYVYGVNRVSRDASGSYEYYHADGIGSTRQLSNDSQSVVQTTTFDAFGNIESSAGTSNNVYRYAGQWGYRNDGDDGLMHVGARYYDALVGRFISADTYLGEIGNPQSLNRYAYCEGDPVNYADPDGHDKVIITGNANGKIANIDCKFDPKGFYLIQPKEIKDFLSLDLGGSTRIDDVEVTDTLPVRVKIGPIHFGG